MKEEVFAVRQDGGSNCWFVMRGSYQYPTMGHCWSREEALSMAEKFAADLSRNHGIYIRVVREKNYGE